MPAAASQRLPNSVPQTGVAARQAIRRGEWTGPTSGLAPGYVQGNLAILPAALASDFMRFCQLNPKPCPVLAAGAPGDLRLPSLGEDLDIRTDLCRYKVFRNGELVDEPTDLKQALARRPRDLRARLLVLVRGRADAGRHRAAPHHQRHDRADVPHLDRDHGRRPVPRPAGGVDAAAASPPTRSARSRSPRAFPPCTARRCTSACRS